MIAALVPAKALSRAKGRLAGVLSEEERRQLSLAMLSDVLRAARAVPQIETVAVVSADQEVLEAAEASGTRAIQEPAHARDLNAALTFATAELMNAGVDTLLVLPMDIPTITPREVSNILEALPSPRGMVVVRSVARGTAALALRPPDAVPFLFGPQSAMAHHREAVRRRVPARILRLPSISIDIDSPQDLLDLISRPAETETHRLLARGGIAERLRPARRPS
ncbi:MAG TPA: 2-phospho-L-lactate guanylyltransferase [Dehalococcoidia bacterium]|nr:2-phospho-L-lactate guanylyltransferase [Dehalococcoidia bacterium]